ncbi:cytochrome b561 domain-containing protein [Acidisoma cladoniae]|uniref:cytochrome b561 domain-containing protein n=1 Tax=Acidisoma cladoniae TaxID=3040935 RepID=UPI00254B8F57|nr:cytochrome b561 domain-containing protein [Acidisoma sp. PAMC 29798]
MANLFLIHAIVMIVAWVILLPAGAMVARFCKVTWRQNWPHVIDNLFWWRVHRALQYSGAAMMLVGVLIAYRATGRVPLEMLHVQAGLVVLFLVLMQIVSTWFRGSKGGPSDMGADPARPETWRGDHYDMTRRRQMFEEWHKTFGWISVGIALVTVLLGLQLLNWPLGLSWLFIGLLALQAGLFAVLLRMSRRIGTYQAIWGPDPTHPGNRRDRP